MNFDFAAALVIATLLTGLIWAADVLWGVPRRRAAAARLAAQGDEGLADAAAAQAALKEPVLVEYAKSFFPVILAVLLLRSFVVEPFRIPSQSMMPTLLVGDFILVNKFDYGLRLPVVDWKILPIGEPHRGDVAVFRYPRDPSVDYIKRIVGLPGDHIAYYNKTLYINGKEMKQVDDGSYMGVGAGVSMSGAKLRTEDLDGVKHHILTLPNVTGLSGDYVVPKGQYFVMGDNRDNSNDSRYWGTVPERDLVGKAFVVWMNWDPSNGGIGWSRIGTAIH
ncbi:MAG TPA: signal peptidase I [Gammaproteobacteria bacterium]|nr:signal peptidase I [Gammaproteobacteria bacterium]